MRLLSYSAALAVSLVAAQAAAYVPDDRWSSTASGSVGVEGEPLTLTWSFARDGTNIPGEGASDLIGYLDDLFDETSSSDDLTGRSWYTLFEESFERWTELSGLTFVYESSDDGRQLSTTGGSLGVRGDIRIGGAYVDGSSSTLAYTWLPNSGDMVIDTGETNFYSSSSSNYRQFRNTVMHELGHALGLLHIESSSDGLLMEPYIDTSFDGPQLDDIRGIQALYGDALEKTNGGLGNGSASLAASLGSLTSGGVLSIGSDAVGDQSVGASETDFVSIANSSDDDFFSFTIDSAMTLDATLTPLGGVFYQGVEGGTQSLFDANSQNDLTLELFGSDGSTLLASVDLYGAGTAETVSGLELTSAGTYYARVSGEDDSVQLYELLLSGSALASSLPGDFNADGVVDAADYTVWRDTQGLSGAGLAADANGDGIVGAADYQLWLESYGAGTSASSASGVAVPTPKTPLLLAVGLTLLAVHRPLRMKAMEQTGGMKPELNANQLG